MDICVMYVPFTEPEVLSAEKCLTQLDTTSQNKSGSQSKPILVNKKWFVRPVALPNHEIMVMPSKIKLFSV